MASLNSAEVHSDNLDTIPVVGDVPNFDTRANTDVFHILDDDLPRPPSPEPLPPATRVPWYKTPSSFWLLPMMILSAILAGATIAPRTELYLKLACSEIRPDYLFVPLPVGLVNGSSLEVLRLQQPNKLSIPSPSKMCTTDPQVQGAVAKLSTGMSTTMGVLSCLTTSSWTRLSDRIGRARVLAIAAFGALLTDIVLILVAYFSGVLPGGYRFLLVGSVLDGALGGWTTATATVHAYVSDTTAAATRSRVFSFYMGALFAGMAIGPALGALLIRHTGDILSIFYIGTALHLLNTILCTFILPESLTEKERDAAKERHLAFRSAHRLTLFHRLRNMVVTFAHPLATFAPRRGSKGRDWNLTLIGIAYGFAVLHIGSFAFQFQYAIVAFQWGTTELGHWMSVVGVTRAAHLLILLPLSLRLLRAFYSRGAEHSHTRLDLLVARLSLIVDVLGYGAAALTANPIVFLLATCWLALGGGFSPSVQSLALALCREPEEDNAQPDYGSTATEGRPASPRVTVPEAGRLFGALSVLQSLASQIIGPLLFGIVFANTVDVAPQAIFWVSAASVLVSFVALSMVRLDTAKGEGGTDRDEESRLLG